MVHVGLPTVIDQHWHWSNGSCYSEMVLLFIVSIFTRLQAPTGGGAGEEIWGWGWVQTKVRHCLTTHYPLSYITKCEQSSTKGEAITCVRVCSKKSAAAAMSASDFERCCWNCRRLAISVFLAFSDSATELRADETACSVSSMIRDSSIMMHKRCSNAERFQQAKFTLSSFVFQ